MPKEQTYISYLCDEDGAMLEFERWGCKKVSTVIKNLCKLYCSKGCYHFLYKPSIEKAAMFKIVETRGGKEDVVYQISGEQFRGKLVDSMI